MPNKRRRDKLSLSRPAWNGDVVEQVDTVALGATGQAGQADARAGSNPAIPTSTLVARSC